MKLLSNFFPAHVALGKYMLRNMRLRQAIYRALEALNNDNPDMAERVLQDVVK